MIEITDTYIHTYMVIVCYIYILYIHMYTHSFYIYILAPSPLPGATGSLRVDAGGTQADDRER